MKKFSVPRRLLAALLSLVMIVGIVPIIPWELETKALNTIQSEYVSLPITIRDYAADGMLFEANELEVGAGGTTTYNGKTFLHYSNSSFGLLASNPNATYKNDVIGIMGGNTYGGDKTQTMENLMAGKVGSINLAGQLAASGDSQDLYTDFTWLGTGFYRNGKWGTGYNKSTTITLNSGATQTLYGGIIRTDLVQPYLHEDGSLEYRKEVVDYMALLLQTTLTVPQIDPSTGYYNMHYVMGQKLDVLGGRDVAQVIRDQIKITEQAGGDVVGSYEDSYERYESEALAQLTDIKTYYDAAYFLLHDMFYDGDGYGTVVDCYNELRLVAKQVVDNGVERTVYVFNSGYDDVDYNYKEGYIINTQTTKATYHSYSTTADYSTYLRGNPWYANRFNPISDELMTAARAYHSTDPDKQDWFYGYGQSGDIYNDYCGQTIGMNQAQYYETTNYHTSIEGRAQFVYYHDQDLYFEFTGDDDVYLFVNNIRVLDVGAAHAISSVRVKLNDVAELCGLEDGKAYDFDFFYMERHGTAANFSVETNIKIVDPSMITTKDGYQYNAHVGYNGFVLPTAPVTYRFGLENNGEAPLHDLTFTDATIGVTLTPEAITLNSATTIDNLYVTLYNPDGSTKLFEQMQTAARLQELLKTGLLVGEKIHIFGFNYLIPKDEWVGTSFVNRVLTTAYCDYGNNDESTRKLTGVADFVVQKIEYLIDPLHVYTWGKLDNSMDFVAGHGEPVTLYKDELLSALEMVRSASEPDGGYVDHWFIPDWDMDITQVPGFEVFPEGYFYEAPHGGALYFEEMGMSFNLGNIDLSQYTSITVSYGARQDSTAGKDGGYLLLTKTGAHQVGPTPDDYDPDFNEAEDLIAKERVDDSWGDWYHGKVTMTIPLDTDYNGPVHLAMDMATEGGTPEGVAVYSIILRGKSDYAIEIDPATATIHLCSSSGVIDAYNVNKNAVLDTATYSVTYTPETTGADTYYYMIKDGKSNALYGPVPVMVFTYGVSDRQFVLDYGLCTDLYNAGGVQENSVTYIEHNQYGTSAHVNKITVEEQYGHFWCDATSKEIHYKLHSFMNDVDTIDLRITVIEDGADELTKFTGVAMPQSVTMVPANVMYYEDDFAAIDYKNDAENLNVWQTYKGSDSNGGAGVHTGQSIDQTTNYGSDPAYATSSSWAAGAKPYEYALNNVLNAADKLLGDASNDTIHKLEVRNPTNQAVMEFTFQGTGFEIISRTTQNVYAVITVKVENKNAAGEWETFKIIPVITESVGGDLYQVPVIDRKDMPYDEYRVTVYTSNARADHPTNPMKRTLYIDGVRVYQPLSADQQEIYYKSNEANAEFYEIKTQIHNGNIVFGEIKTPDAESATNTLQMIYGYSMIENYRNEVSVLTNTQYEGKETEEHPLWGKDEYMQYGPNNEIYLSGVYVEMNFIAFYLEKDPTVADADRTIQVGAHTKYNITDIGFGGTGSVQLRYGGSAAEVFDGGHTATVSSNTEQYITIDHSVLVEIAGKCLLIIGTEDRTGCPLALTNLKLKGYKLVGTSEGDISAETELNAILDAYDTNVSTMAAEAVALNDLYGTDVASSDLD